MGRLGNNILTFSQDQGVELDLYAKFKDYVNHYKAIQFRASTDYDNSCSFEEKNKKMHEDIEKEIVKLSGVKTDKFSTSIVRTNPMYK
jgi:hypothetical protein